MKREGRQHGMVRTYPFSSAPWDPRPKPWSPGGGGLTSTPTAGSFAKVPTKPTNHSKFTGKCGRPMCRECHVSPTSKSKDKAKGAQRLGSSSDVVLDYKLITRRVVDATSGLRLWGFSATSVLDYLDDDDYLDDEELDYVIEIEANNNGEDHQDLSFSEFVWQLEDGDQDWCLV